MNDKPLILAVDRNRRNLELLAQFLDKEGYQTICAASIEEFEQALSGETEIGLVLVDLSGFDRQIWEWCERVREKQIPFFVISPKQSAAIQQESLAHGARNMLVKPLVIRELLGIVRGLMGTPT
ncbi:MULTISPECIES: response regulator [Aerosakkonema]|uniref:Response regulator transcription factor n=1 Tax=Aerosakkonema funiforme FACHB-1375 TaxID=2949571 RepID=A0A926VA10_9CYAN|nr:response regulator [Aerosakkonema funiforme]MBD2179860.1 response regulator transcription factor [Aerosakkonema funiforme FACHB-1375]